MRLSTAGAQACTQNEVTAIPADPTMSSASNHRDDVFGSTVLHPFATTKSINPAHPTSCTGASGDVTPSESVCPNTTTPTSGGRIM